MGRLHRPGRAGRAGRAKHAPSHLLARRDPADNQWYFFDPYGIYSRPEQYPAGITDDIPKACLRYPVAWKGGRPQYPA